VSGTVATVRLGCGGCLSTLIVLTVAGGLAAAGGWGLMRCLQSPARDAVAFSREDGTRAQRKLLELARERPRSEGLVISEAEVNAFVAYHIDPADFPLRDPIIRLREGGGVDIAGTVTLERVLRESSLTSLADLLPSGWTARPLWLTVNARTRVVTDRRRTLRLEARRLAIGRQRVPSVLLPLILDPSMLRFMRIGLPRDVQAVRVERGRVVIETTSPRPRTAAAGRRSDPPASSSPPPIDAPLSSRAAKSAGQ